MPTVSYRFRVRRRTAANWTSLNEVLLDSEIGLESDTRKFKIGDGVTAWNLLFYSAPGLFDLTGMADGDALVWDATSGKFITAPAGTSISAIAARIAQRC